MDVRLTYKLKPENLWYVSMYKTYSSMAGLVNIIFTVSMVLLALRYWPEVKLLFKCLMTAGILLFPVLQPLLIYLRSRKLASGMPGNLEMRINKDAVHISSGKTHSRLSYRDFIPPRRIRGMIILQTVSGHSYLLDKPSLNGKDQIVFDFLAKAMSK